MRVRLLPPLLYLSLLSTALGCRPEASIPDPPGGPATFGFGRPAADSEIAAWDQDVRPDGLGLPPGSGTVWTGSAIYAEKCAACHGATGVEGPNDILVGRTPNDSFEFGSDPELVETVGNYWPYATTLYDYIQRAMPYDAPGSLTPDEVYSLSAFILHRNEIIPADAVIDAETLPAVEMPARNRFVPDDRRGVPEIR